MFIFSSIVDLCGIKLNKINVMKKGILLVAAISLLAMNSCKKKGCTDEAALNYSEKAKKDDGSCEYTEVDPLILITNDITTETTLTSSNISICGNINVTAGLIIPEGATITMCSSAEIEVSGSGYIKAIGTASDPILFKGETESKGFWKGIAFESNNPNNQLSYVTIKDGGSLWYWDYANVYVSGSLSIDHSTLSNSQDVGLFIDDNGQLTNFGNNTFSNSTTGLSVRASQVANLDEASNYNNGNTNDFISVRGGIISVPSVWKKTTTPLLITDLEINAGLTLSPGTVIQMETGSIEVATSGYLNSVGTALSPISITGRFSAPAYWNGLEISSNNPNNVFKYTTVADGGKIWYFDYANIHIAGGSLEMDDCTISNANSYGVYLESGSQIITSGNVQTTATGVEANNTFSSNGTGANANCTSGCTVFFN
jgi:hypothetical protein